MKKIPAGLILIFLLIIFASCTTMKAVPGNRSVERFIELYNSGDTERMTEMTSVPMLIDGEIVARSSDADFFWSRLSDVGFNFSSMENYTVELITENSQFLFGNTKEVSLFFDKYVPDTAVIVKIYNPGGDFILLLSGRKGRYPFIFGFTGPVL
jgi:hypothetical protein